MDDNRGVKLSMMMIMIEMMMIIIICRHTYLPIVDDLHGGLGSALRTATRLLDVIAVDEYVHTRTAHEAAEEGLFQVGDDRGATHHHACGDDDDDHHHHSDGGDNDDDTYDDDDDDIGYRREGRNEDQ